MNILVFNCGSSSLKYRLIGMPGEEELTGGEAQRIGPPTAEPARVVFREAGRQQTLQADMPDHGAALMRIMELLKRDPAWRPDAVAHRLVNGGPRLSAQALVDDAVMAELEAALDLAPLHNPPAVAVVRVCRERFPELPQVVVSDTAFHATIPEYARAYALPRSLTAPLGIRKYGYHGISHEYVTHEAARFLGVPIGEFNAVSCHLGSGGASLCAIVGGRSVDNTMGYSPLQGLVMSTRSGDLDPGAVLRLLARPGATPQSVEAHLNRRSGVLGVTGVSADIRDALRAAEGSGPVAERSRLALQIYLWRLRKYLGAYLVIVGRPHAVVFTDTIGETVPAVRHAVCTDMAALGLRLDAARNRAATDLPVDVATADSPVRILVIATNEELSIARSAHAALVGV